MSQQIITSSAVKDNFSKLIKKADEEFNRYIITVKGHPKAVLLSYQDFEDMQEELEILAQNPGFFEERQKAHQDFKDGKTISLHNLNKEFGI